MEIWVLGTLEVSHDGRPVDVRGPLPRRLLALLALTPGREVSTERILEVLWGDDAPAAATTTLQSHVARLRRDLPVPAVLRTGRHGYVLDLRDEDVDATRFERDVARGGAALAAGRLDDASTVLTSALELWRGTPYAEFAGCSPLEVESDRLATLRLDALEQRISADLGRPGVAPPTAELEALVRWHPMRESFWALLMAAQYRAGRQADALASYQRARSALAEELGVDPGPALQELERLVLAQDPSLETAGMSTFLPTRRTGEPYSRDVALLERDQLLATLRGLLEDVGSGSGRLAFVHGEAGAGKSALVHALARDAAGTSRVLHGACDPLSSPRPLGPLVDLAPHLDPGVGELLRSGERDGLFETTLTALDTDQPTVVVIEDLHWADMSTLDLVRFLARRIGGTRLLVVATYRDDDLGPAHPLRVLLGDLASQPVVRRLAVPPLSRDAVAELVGDGSIDVDALMRETGGNAFFVSEVIASGGAVLPPTIQDAVLARAQRLSPQARLALESAAVIGSRIEPSLIHGMPDVSADAVDECVTAGMLRFEAPTYSFRHELVRQSVLSGIAPGRLGALHWQALDRLRSIPMSPKPFARLAEHAAMAGDPPAILEYAVAAGDSAAGLGSHREAAFQYGRAMPYADLLDDDARIELLGKRALECQVADDHEHAIEAWDRQVDLLRMARRDLEAVDALLGLDESYYTIGDNSHGTAFVDEAFELLDTSVPSAQLGRVLARRGVHFVRASDTEAALPWLERGLAMAREMDDAYTVARTSSNLGVTHYLLGETTRGIDEVDEGLRTALASGEEEMAGRIYQTVAGLTWLEFDLVEAHARMEEAERYTAEHDLNGHLMCVLATEVTWKVELGRWDEAMDQSHDLLYVRNTGRASRVEPLTVIGLLGARRGDRDDVWTYLDEARDYIAKSQVVGYQAPLATARGEVYLLEGRIDEIRAEVLPWFAAALRVRDVEALPDIAMVVWRAGLIDAPPDELREPERWSMTGRHREAHDFWSRVGAPYKAAWALLDSDEELDIREARSVFDRLGAAVLVARCDDKLRSIGAKVPRGARASTRANVGGLTDRETEVLELLDEGLRNADIAARLHLSEKTVGHHVSAILAKLGASSRTEAVRRARDLATAG
jgi:DNA-binding SARP family transcriptional activator/DNA-binding CsgD family transcriptional regulator